MVSVDAIVEVKACFFVKYGAAGVCTKLDGVDGGAPGGLREDDGDELHGFL
jgi:hypothetical protein